MEESDISHLPVFSGIEEDRDYQVIEVADIVLGDPEAPMSRELKFVVGRDDAGILTADGLLPGCNDIQGRYLLKVPLKQITQYSTVARYAGKDKYPDKRPCDEAPARVSTQ